MPALPLVRVRLKYPDVETLVERFAPNVTRGGIFLASREPKTVGSQIRFEVSLLSGMAVLAGEGRVTWVKPFDPEAPNRPHGMGVSFTRLDPACKEMFRRLIDRRENAPARRPSPHSNGAAPKPPLPYSPELERIDEAGMKRALERARALGGEGDTLDALLLPPAAESRATLAEALADLPRYLERRRPTGSARAVTDTRPREAGGAEAESADARESDDAGAANPPRRRVSDSALAAVGASEASGAVEADSPADAVTPGPADPVVADAANQANPPQSPGEARPANGDLEDDLSEDVPL